MKGTASIVFLILFVVIALVLAAGVFWFVGEKDRLNAQITSLTKDKNDLTTQITSLNKDKNDLTAQLAAKVPLKYFSSVPEAEQWANSHIGNKWDSTDTPDIIYGHAITIAEEAANDGYYLWISIDQDERITDRLSARIVLMTYINDNLYWYQCYDQPIQLKRWVGIVPTK